MKKIVLSFLILLMGCSSPRAVIDNTAALKTHPQPYSVFGIGLWSEGYYVLTLNDASMQYFSIIIPQKTDLKVGDIYVP